MQDLFNSIKVAPALDITTVTDGNATTAGDVIDRQGFESVTFVFKMGVLTDGDYTILIEDADEVAFNVTNAAVPDHLLLGTEAGASFTADTDDQDVAKIGYIGGKPYVRMSVVQSGGTGGAVFTGVCVLGHPLSAPQSAQIVAD